MLFRLLLRLRRASKRPRLRPGFFLACLALLFSLRGCDPAPKRTIPAPLCRLYYTHADDPADGLTVSGLTAAELRACGFDAILTSGGGNLRYRWLTETLSEDAVRTSLAPIVAAADGMPLWLELGVSYQGVPARTFYAPTDQVARARALANIQLVAQIAAEYGITRLGFDWEAYGVSAWTHTYPTPRARVIGAELAQAARRGNPSVSLFGFCPLSFYAQCPGFRALARGWYGGAGPSGVMLNEDAYGMQGDVPRLLRWTRQYTQARQCGAGWFASDRATAGAAWFYQCAPEIRAAVGCCPVLLVYREGAPLWRDRPDLRDAAGNVLRSLTAP